MDQYRVGEFRDTFFEMFRTVETSAHNPMRRAFLVFEEGDLDGNSAFWAEDEEDGAEGFVDALEDVFWTWDDLVENFTEQKREKEKARSRHSAVMKDVIVHRQQMIPKFCWSMFQQLRCETHIIPTLLPFQPNTARCSSAKFYNGSRFKSETSASPNVEWHQQTNPPPRMQKHPMGRGKNFRKPFHLEAVPKDI